MAAQTTTPVARDLPGVCADTMPASTRGRRVRQNGPRPQWLRSIHP